MEDMSFQKMLDVFALRGAHEVCAVANCQRCLSEEYLVKYWLSEDEYRNCWSSVENRVFCLGASCLPDMMFQEEFIIIAGIGGVVFGKNDFHALQKCMKEIGDKEFVIIESYRSPFIDNSRPFPQMKLKFSVDVTWNEMKNMGVCCPDVSYEIFRPVRKFFIFGDSALWGKYASNDYWDSSVDPVGTPLDIIGFKPELTPIFKKHFNFDEHFCYHESVSEYLTQEDIAQHRMWLPKWLPLSYKRRMGLMAK